MARWQGGKRARRQEGKEARGQVPILGIPLCGDGKEARRIDGVTPFFLPFFRLAV